MLQHSARAGKPFVSGSCVVDMVLTAPFGIIELFKPTPMMLVSIRILPDEFRIQSKLPLSNASQTSGSISPWTKLPFQYMTAAGIVTAVINNNTPDLTKHAWGLKGLIVSPDHLYLYAVMEWQHADIVHIPSQASVPSVPPPVSVQVALLSVSSTHSLVP